MLKAVRKAAAAFIVAAAAIFSSQLYAMSADAATWPVDSSYTQISTYFNAQRNVYNVSGYHNGMDIPAPAGSNIYAIASGRVISASWMDAYGYMVVLWHEDLGIYTFYAHCSSMAVSAGQTVSEGQVIAYVGNTGESYGAHLHIGVCSSLQNGWPTVTFYDPLTYFSYGSGSQGGGASLQSPDDWGSTDCAGIYTTKNVTTYLNIRVSRDVSSTSIGKVYAGSVFKVIKADENWAYIEHEGVTGYAARSYIEKMAEATPSMSIEGATAPAGNIPPGQTFEVRGNISSELPIVKVWGGIYDSEGNPTAQYYETSASVCSYDLNKDFDSHIAFNELDNGYYTYIIKAEDSQGNVFELINTEFTVGNPGFLIIGDVNGDGLINIADVVMLQNYLIGSCEFTEASYICSDLNGDSKVNVFDMLCLQDAVPEA